MSEIVLIGGSCDGQRVRELPKSGNTFLVPETIRHMRPMTGIGGEAISATRPTHRYRVQVINFYDHQFFFATPDELTDGEASLFALRRLFNEYGKNT